MDDPSDMPEPIQRQQQDTTSSSARISSSRGNEKRKLEGQTNTHESSVYERAKHLDEMGFTQVIKQLIKYYTDQANDNLFNKSSPMNQEWKMCRYCQLYSLAKGTTY